MDQPMHQWVNSFPAAVTVTDSQGIIIEMNDASVEVFKKDGGRDLIGKHVLSCHPGQSRVKL